MGSDQLEEIANEILDLIPTLWDAFPYFHKKAEFFEIEAARRVFISRGLSLDRSDFAERLPDAKGNEHEVWVFPGYVVKATYPNAFGFLPWGAFATPVSYLSRIRLTNEIFQDDIRLLGAWIDSSDRFRVVTKQPFVVGRKPQIPRLSSFFLKGALFLSKASRRGHFG